MTLHVFYFPQSLLLIESAVQWFQGIEEKDANAWQNTLERKCPLRTKVSEEAGLWLLIP